MSRLARVDQLFRIAPRTQKPGPFAHSLPQFVRSDTLIERDRDFRFNRSGR